MKAVFDPRARRPADEAERRRAVEDLARNVVVVAGAGSGKTALLVERAIHALLEGGVEPRELAAITFTEAAATEMRERLRGALEELASEAGSGAPAFVHTAAERTYRRAVETNRDRNALAARARALLASIEDASVSTLHAFCRQLLARHPLAAGVPIGFALDESGERERALGERWPEILRERSAAASDAAEVLDRFELRDLAALLGDLLAPAAPLDAWDRAPIPAPDVGAALRALAASFVPALATAADVLGPTAYGVLVADLASRARDLSAWNGGSFPASVRERVGDASKSTSKKVADVIADCERARRFFKLLAEVDDAAMEGAVRFLLPAAGAERERAVVESGLTFDALLVHARDLLRDRADVRRAEARRLRAVLVDEFQDTDPLQYEIVFFLAERDEGAPAHDAWSARLAPGRLFVVGDPKQSIYRFRGADIAAFQRAVEKIESEGGARSSLTVSFRSAEAILGPVDRLFRGWLDERAPHDPTDAAPSYERIEAFRADSPSAAPAVEVWAPAEARPSEEGGKSKTKAFERRDAEARAIAEDVVARGAADRRRPGDHAILLRTFSDVALYARALERRGVPYLLEGGRTFYARAEVAELAAWLRAAAEPNDAVAMLTILRAPSGGAPDAELAAFADARAAAGRAIWSAWEEVDARAFPNVARAFALVRELRREAQTRDAGELTRVVLGRARFFELHAAFRDGAQRIANLRKCEQVAGQLARSGARPLDDVAAELTRRVQSADAGDAERSLDEGVLDAVRILTIHKAKGLEFPVVYVADLARATVARDGLAELRPPESSGAPWLDAAAPGSALRTLASAVRTFRETSYAAAEERRLFYVAATRAKERLVFVGAPAPRGDWSARVAEAFALPSTPSRAAGDGVAEGTVLFRSPPIETDARFAERERVDLVPAARRFREWSAAAASAARAPLRAPSARKSARPASGDEDEVAANPREAVGAHARAVGAAVHAILERASFAGDGPIADRASIAARARDAAVDEAVAPRAVADDAAEILDRFAAGRLRARLRAARVVARELAVVAEEPEGAVAGFADLVFEENGALVVADWKTDALDAGADRRAAAERHRDQLLTYARAIARASRRAVRAEVWWLRVDESTALATVEAGSAER